MNRLFCLYPIFFTVLAGVLGACVGSFLNVVIYRVPAEKSVITPGSHCACGAPIAWYDNIPILSWFILRGRARCCGKPYSLRYSVVELLTAALFVACWLMFPFNHAKAFIGMGFVSVMVAVTFIDLDHMIIPDAFSLGGGVAGVVLSFLFPALHKMYGPIFMISSVRSGVASLEGLLIGSGIVLWIALLAEVVLRKEAMGFGDVKFLGMIGAFCGWQGALFSLFGGAVVNLVWVIASLAWVKITGHAAAVAPKATTPDGDAAELGIGVQIPFGPGLAIAGGLYFLFFQPMVAAWFAGVTAML
jgi:leader peptidase (prepilin peptidase)/N-methyltransferase